MRSVGLKSLRLARQLSSDRFLLPQAAGASGGKKAPPKRGLSLEAIAARLALILLIGILLAGILLPALLSALAGLLGLLTRVALLSALLAALVRIALVLLSALILVCHFVSLFLFCG